MPSPDEMLQQVKDNVQKEFNAIKIKQAEHSQGLDNSVTPEQTNPISFNSPAATPVTNTVNQPMTNEQIQKLAKDGRITPAQAKSLSLTAVNPLAVGVSNLGGSIRTALAAPPPAAGTQQQQQQKISPLQSLMHSFMGDLKNGTTNTPMPSTSNGTDWITPGGPIDNPDVNSVGPNVISGASVPDVESDLSSNAGDLLASDENLKENITPADYETQSFLDALKAHTFNYKDDKHGKGKFISVMAQELEKTHIGKQAVIETKDGKAVDYARLAQVHLASTSMLNKKIKQLEVQINMMNKERNN